MQIYVSVLAFIVGAVMGSFLNCLAYRVAHKTEYTNEHGRLSVKKTFFTRSRCPSCGHELNAIDLIPVFGWIIRKGKCKYCSAHISARYVIAELLMGVLSVLCVLRFDVSVDLLRAFILFCCLFCASLVDIEIREIPTGAVIFAAVAWVCFVPFSNDPLITLRDGLIAGAVLVAVILLITIAMEKILKKECLGGGDVKLFGLMGLYLGPFGSILAVFTACVTGLCYAIFKKIAHSKRNDNETKDMYFAFGPFIAAATVFVTLYGSPIISAYLSLF